MFKVKKMPPPVIDSAKLLVHAYNDEDVVFTDHIDLFVGEDESLKRLCEVPCLAICSDFSDQQEILLFFCDIEWKPKGVIAFSSTEKAKNKAERGYNGINEKWKNSPYSKNEVDEYLIKVYKVNPKDKWW